jgi:pimeloyl-ACP methyl ester carboxylesterase
MRPGIKEAFRFLDRGRKDSIVLIPGWATDHRIFDLLDLDYNYILPIGYSPFWGADGFTRFLRERKIEKVSLFGWSLGGFRACDFAARYPGMVSELILVGIRERYDPEGLDSIEQQLRRNKRGYLYKFYSQCFFDKDERARFKMGLMKSYLKELSLESLLDSLDHLRSAEIKPEGLRKAERITILHGTGDRIAPIEEARRISEGLKNARFVPVAGAGHMPFLNSEFNSVIASLRPSLRSGPRSQ